MIQSMTGFGSAEHNNYRVEIRSLNHKFLDIYIKAPPFFNQLEMDFRNILKEKFSRGKFDVNILVLHGSGMELEVNATVAEKIYSGLKRLQQDYSIPGELDINTIAGFKEIFVETNVNYDIDLIHDIFKKALKNLLEMRNREGIQLAQGLCEMLDSLAAMNEKVRGLSSSVVSALTEKFNERLEILLAGKDMDSSRMLQEAAIIASKLDISEEITRIDSHVRQFREILANGDIIGRKLDFILQELNREVNTIASKSSDYNLSSLTVEMKTVIEQVREQVQNIQ